MPRTRTTAAADQKLFDDIEEFGWHCLHVLEEEGLPAFSFTIGLFASYGYPELLIYGLPRKTAHGILTIAAKAAKDGHPIAAGEPTDALLNGYSCLLVPIAQEHYREHLGTAIWYYEHKLFPAMQVVWPNKDALFPWHEAASSSFRSAQPYIGAVRGDA